MTQTPASPAPFRDARLVVFDLDGTLADAFGDIALLLNRALEHWGFAELPFETIRGYIGDGPRVLLGRALGEAGAARLDEIYPWYRTFYEAHHGSTVTAFPGAAELLTALRARGLKLAVLTNKPHGVTGPLLERLGLAPLLDGHWGQLDGSAQKPEAEALLRVARHFGVDPAEVVMIGDGPADFAVAHNAGARTIGVTYGQLSRAQLEALHPDALVDSLPEILPLFD